MNEQESFCVSLLSNSSKDIYPGNTVYKFTNVLGKEINFPSNENWRVCVHSVCMSNIIIHENDRLLEKKRKAYKRLQRKTKNKKDLHDSEYGRLMMEYDRTYLDISSERNVIFIESSVIRPKFGESQVMSIFQTPNYSPKNSPYCSYQPVTNEYFDLSSPCINEITVNIQNYKGHNLRTHVSQPTIIVLKFKKMNISNNDYYTLRVESKENDDPSNFKVSLPEGLVGDGKQNPWEVALTKFIFSPAFQQFPEGTFQLSYYDTHDEFKSIMNGDKELEQNDLGAAERPIWDNYLKNDPHQTDEITFPEHASVETFMNWVRRIVKEVCKVVNDVPDLNRNDLLQNALLQNNTNTESLPKVIVTLSTDKRVTFKARESCCLYMPTELVYVLGFEGLTYSLEPGYEMLCLEKNVTTKANREIDVDFMVPQNFVCLQIFHLYMGKKGQSIHL